MTKPLNSLPAVAGRSFLAPFMASVRATQNMKHLLISAILIFPLLSIAQEQCEDTLIEHSEESVQFDVSVNDTSLVGIPGAEVKIVRLHMKYDEPAIILSKYESVTDKRGNATLNPVMPSYWQYSGALEQSGVNN